VLSVSQALALAWQQVQAGSWQQAEYLCRQVLQVEANHAEALHCLGLVAYQTGRVELAIDYYRQSLRRQPDSPEALNNLGIALRRQGEAVEAVCCFQQALALAPTSAQAHYNLGNSLADQGRSAEAVSHFQEALRHQPGLIQARNNLGLALQDQGKLDEALAHFQQALRLQPDYVEAHTNLANTLRERGHFAEAIAHLEHALRLKPDYAEALGSLATTLLEQGKLDEALICFDQALRVRPDFAEAHYNRSVLVLLRGDFEHGWPEFEWRWQLKPFRPFRRPHPRWDGSRLDGKTILLHAEQGMGDTFQFIRYAAIVRQRGGTVVVECQPELTRVLSGCAGIDLLVPCGAPLPPCDVRAPLLSLPGLCKTTLNTIPAQIPYLVADAARVSHLRTHLAGVSGVKVGICWQGSPHHRHDRRRSVPLTQFAPLASVPGVHLISLQRGPGQEQWHTMAESWPVVELPGLEQEPAPAWVETAALLGALDLVITVDTAVAHLAGALGVPVWVALPFLPDWRWLLGRQESPWYPTMRLFRQTRPGYWPDVFERMAVELELL
jgi:tetratricopeptide (TPR) repeat protein